MGLLDKLPDKSTSISRTISGHSRNGEGTGPITYDYDSRTQVWQLAIGDKILVWVPAIGSIN